MVVTVTTAFSVRGYCKIGNEPTARNPSTRIIRLTTLASTGRRMNTSVKFMPEGPALPVVRLWIDVVRRLHRVVHHDRRLVAQLELTGGDDDVAFLDASEQRDLIAPSLAGGDEGLSGDRLRLAVGVLALVVDDIDEIAIGIVDDRRLRQRDQALGRAGVDVDRGKHPRQQPMVGVFQGSADLDVARGGVDQRVDRGDLAVELL